MTLNPFSWFRKNKEDFTEQILMLHEENRLMKLANHEMGLALGAKSLALMELEARCLRILGAVALQTSEAKFIIPKTFIDIMAEHKEYKTVFTPDDKGNYLVSVIEEKAPTIEIKQ